MRVTIFASLALALIGCGGPHTDNTPNQMNPSAINYPAGPYGYAQNSIIQNLAFVGKLDPAGAAGTASYDQLPMKPIQLADYYQSATVKYLMISGVAGWCPPCNNEQVDVVTAQQAYEAKGVVFLEALVEGFKFGVASTETDLDHWQANHSLHVGIMLDPNDYIHQYADYAAFPLNMVVSTSDMRIQYMQVGEVDPNMVLSSIVP
jgi:hypothetical protein